MANTSQIDLLKQKLHSAKSALADINIEQSEKLQLLLQFIGHLSLACKGQNLELDNKLAKLRHQLTDIETIDASLPDIAEVEQILKQQYNHVMLQLEEGRSGLSKVVTQIQRVDSLPEKVKKELNYFKKDLAKPFHTFWDYIPKVEKMVSFYDQILQAQLAQGDKLIVLPKHQQLAKELSQMLSEVEFRNEQEKQVTKIKTELSREVDLEGLIDIYQSVLALLLDSIAREKSASQEFLSSLNEALSAVKEVVTETFNNQNNGYKIKKKLNIEINSQVDNVDDSINEIDDLKLLKVKVTEQLASIRSALGRKETIEDREQAMLKKSMAAMKKELSTLSQEANSYKERLVEQQKLNLLDTLTQLPNRAALEERMEQEFRNFKRKKQSLWVAVADIDHFKNINDNFGHTTGDKTLQVIAMALKNSLRDTEFVARYGGEEFVLLIPTVNEVDIEQLLNRVREKVKSIPFKFKGKKITVTVSIGAAQVLETEQIADTFERADAALFQAKHQNRDRVIIDA